MSSLARQPLPLLRVPPDLLSRFRWVVGGFTILNFVVFGGLAVAKGPSAALGGGTLAALLLAGALVAHAYQRHGPTVLHDFAIALCIALASRGLPKVSMAMSLVFAWLTWVQLYQPLWRAVVRLGLAVLLSGWCRDSGVFAVDPAQLVGISMACIFSFALGAALARVQASEARFRGLVQHSADLFIVMNEQGQVTYATENAAALVGQWQGKRLVDLAAPERRAEFEGAFSRSLKAAAAQRVELTFAKAGGGVVETEVLLTDERANLDIAGVVANVRDVTERKAADRALQEKERELNETKHEVELAAHIQSALLPAKQLVKGFDIAAAMSPATEVGGDYYDILPVEGGVYVGIGDVAGHGLQAGLIMLMTQSVVSALVSANPKASPKEIVVHLNRVLFENIRKRLKSTEHVTFTLLRIGNDGAAVYAGAHEDLLIRRSATRQVEAIATSGTWLGAVPDITDTCTQGTFRLERGDMLLLHSDGITEARNTQREEYGPERLTGVMSSTPGDAQTLCAAMQRDVHAWTPERADDQTLVLLEYVGA